MFSLTIVFGPSPVPWVLLFKSEDAANAAFDIATGKPEFVRVTDDFGQTIMLKGGSIHGIMREDMEQSKLAHVEQALHRARTQAKAQTLARSDQVLQAAAMMGGAPMLQPGFGGPNGAFRGQ